MAKERNTADAYRKKAYEGDTKAMNNLGEDIPVIMDGMYLGDYILDTSNLNKTEFIILPVLTVFLHVGVLDQRHDHGDEQRQREGNRRQRQRDPDAVSQQPGKGIHQDIP